MKKILVIIDGLGDLPIKQFKGKTPLDYAETPNLDEMAKNGKLGYMYPVNESYAPESHAAVVSILGNDHTTSPRGIFEAIGAGVKLTRGDLALRANFATIDDIKNRRMIDRRSGRTLSSKEARQLSKSLNKEIELPVKFEFVPTVQHRGVLVLRGGFSDNITNIDVYRHEKGIIHVKDKFAWCQPLDDEENTEFAANVINSFVDQSFKILNNHPINNIRKKRGLLPANVVLARDAGIEIPKLKQFKKSMAILNMPVEIGACKLSGMDIYSMSYPNMKNYDVYENLYNGLSKMLRFSSKVLRRKGGKYDFCYIHFKETDVPGHDNKPFEKKNFIEMIDKGFFKYLKKYADKYNVKVVVTADHSTPCKLKTHTADPVPVLFYDPNAKGDKTERFSEVQAEKGSLGKIKGKDLLKKVGFVA